MQLMLKYNKTKTQETTYVILENVKINVNVPATCFITQKNSIPYQIYNGSHLLENCVNVPL